MLDSTLLNRPTLAARTHSGRLIAIGSGKGGVGKTWFAVTLAHALSRLGRRVLLFDGDLGLANVDIQLGLMPRHDLGAVLAGRVGLSEACQRAEPGGFDVLAGRSGTGLLSGLGALASAGLIEALKDLACRYDDVLLDLGAGVEQGVRSMAAAADLLLVLATEEPTSLTDAYATLKLHAADRPGGPARIVVNQCTSPAAGQRTYATLARACQAFLGHTPALAGLVRRDGRVADAIRRQTPLLTRHPNSFAGGDVARIAEALV